MSRIFISMEWPKQPNRRFPMSHTTHAELALDAKAILAACRRKGGVKFAGGKEKYRIEASEKA